MSFRPFIGTSSRKRSIKEVVSRFHISKEVLQEMDHLDKLVARLETVTAKLENLGSSKPQPAPKPAHLGGGNG